MSDILEIHEIRFDGPDCLVVEAVVDGMVLQHKGTHLDSPEWGPALCRGTMLFCEEDLIPATDAEFRRVLSERIDDWSPLDQSDLYD